MRHQSALAPTGPILRVGAPALAAVVMALAVASVRADMAPPDETPPEVAITRPEARTELPPGTTRLTVEVKADDPDSGVLEVELLVDGKVAATLEHLGRDDGDPWVFADVALAVGEHSIVARASNYDVETAYSAPILVHVAAPPATAEPKPDDAKTITDAKASPTVPADPPAGSVAVGTPATPASAVASNADAKPEDGCFASARPRSLIGSGIAFAIALVAGLALRRRAR